MRIFSFILSAAIALPALVSAADPTPREIIARQIETSKLDGAEMLSTLTIYNEKKQKRERTIASVSKLFDNGATEKRLLRFVAPADVKGTGLLTFDYDTENDDMWLFMPALRKTRRLVSSDKAKSFMGSEFSYADITPPALDDYTYESLGTEELNGSTCWIIAATPKSEEIAEENGYSKRITYVAQKDFVVRKAIYHDLSGELLKELAVEKVEEIDTTKHRFRPMFLTMVNKQNGRSSEMRVQKINLRADIPAEYFTTRYLERQ